MKLIRKNKVIDLDKFDTVRYRESLLGKEYGWPVEAVRIEAGGGFFGGQVSIEEVIVRLNEEEVAMKLVKEISEHWVNEEKSFDVDVWLEQQI